MECDGKRLTIGEIEKDVDFVWRPDPNALRASLEPVTITVAYAPHYTLVSIQTFTIPPMQPPTDDSQQPKAEI